MKHTKTFLAGLVLIGLVVGYGLGMYHGKKRYQYPVPQGLAGPIPESAEVRAVFGVVKDVEEGVVKVQSQSFDNPAQTAVWEVVVGEKTEIVKNVRKEQEVYQKEIAAFQKKVEALQKSKGPLAAPPIPPLPHEEKTVTLSAIKEGDIVRAEAGENIRKKARFEAVRIVIREELPGSATGGLAIPPPPLPPSGSSSSIPPVPPPPPLQ